MDLLALVVGLVAGIELKDYLPSYIRKKGENLATKEDIEEITRKIESVKATVTLDKEREKQLLDTKQMLLMNFYDEITALYYEHLAVNFGDFPSDFGKSLFEYQQAFYKSVALIMKSYQRLVIFLPANSPLMKTATALAQCSADARTALKKNFGKVKIASIEEQRVHTEGSKEEFRQAVKAADEANSKYWEEMRPHVELFGHHYQEFLREMNSYVSPGTA
jgi:hypothetical protein